MMAPLESPSAFSFGVCSAISSVNFGFGIPIVA